MFDGISMIELDIITPIQRDNYVNKLMPYLDEKSESFHAFNCSFSLSGKQMHALLPLPLTEDTHQNYMHLQSFIVLEANTDYYTRRSNFDSYLLLYTYSGEGILEYEQKTYYLHANEGFLIDCRKPHYYRTNGSFWKHSDLHFWGGMAEALYNEFQKNNSAVFSCSSANEYQIYLEKILKHYSARTSHRSFYVHNAISDLITFILTENENKHSEIPETYQFLIKYMDNNYMHDLSLDHLSKFSNISKYHLVREFKKYTNYSPIEYIIELRLTHAKFLIQNTNIPIYRIGEIVGIHNETNFTRLFKKRVGILPGKYRNTTEHF